MKNFIWLAKPKITQKILIFICDLIKIIRKDWKENEILKSYLRKLVSYYG